MELLQGRRGRDRRAACKTAGGSGENGRIYDEGEEEEGGWEEDAGGEDQLVLLLALHLPLSLTGLSSALLHSTTRGSLRQRRRRAALASMAGTLSASLPFCGRNGQVLRPFRAEAPHRITCIEPARLALAATRYAPSKVPQLSMSAT